MAAITYPADGPKPLRKSLRQSYLDTFVDDRGEIGDPRRRNRFTRALRFFRFAAVVTEAQRLALDEFYVTTLSNGVKAFDWTHPITAEIIEVKFASRPSPQDFPVDRWRMSISLEEI